MRSFLCGRPEVADDLEAQVLRVLEPIGKLLVHRAGASDEHEQEGGTEEIGRHQARPKSRRMPPDHGALLRWDCRRGPKYRLAGGKAPYRGGWPPISDATSARSTPSRPSSSANALRKTTRSK